MHPIKIFGFRPTAQLLLTALLVTILAVTGEAQTAQPNGSKDSLQTVTVTAKRQLIVLTPNKITLNVAESPIAAGGNIYEVLLRAPGVLEQSGTLSFRGKGV